MSAATLRGAGVVVLPDRDGLRDFHAELAERFAAAGHHAIAIDARPDIAGAVELVRSRTGGRSAVALGFGAGGGHALRAAADPGPGLAGAVAVSPELRGDVIEHARAAAIPVLALFGGTDRPEDVVALGAALAAAGVERELVTYHGALPGFLGDPSHDAWARILGFLEPAALERAA